MSEVTIIGIGAASYVRTAMMICEEKGVSYDLETIEFNSPAHLEDQPFGKMPAFRHGNLLLHETVAIGVYVDRTFEGPALQPDSALQQALMFKWISSIADYGYQNLIRDLVIPRLVGPSRGQEPDEDAIKASLPKIEIFLKQAEDTLAGSDYLAGSSISLADLFLAPIIASVMRTPEGQVMVPQYKSVTRWFEAIAARPSFAAAHPPPAQAAAE